MLYNTGQGRIEEISFQEVSLSKNALMLVKPSYSMKASEEQMLIKVREIPVCMMASKNKEKL